MTTQECIKTIEVYYGYYDNDVVRKFVIEYIEENVKEKELLVKKLIANHPKNYGPPDVAAIHKASAGDDQEIENRGKKIFAKILDRLNIYRDMIIEDIDAQEAIKDIGGYSRLCQTDMSEIKWKEKDFLASYTYRVKNNVGGKLDRLCGIGEFGEPIVIGEVKDIPQITDNYKIKQLAGGAVKRI